MTEEMPPPPIHPSLKGKITMKELEKDPEIKNYWLSEGRVEGVLYTLGVIALMAISFTLGGWIF